MAYSDYGAFVWLNGERRRDKEDVATFATDEETFGESSENIPSGARIWVSLIHQQDQNVDWVNHIHHGYSSTFTPTCYYPASSRKLFSRVRISCQSGMYFAT